MASSAFLNVQGPEPDVIAHSAERLPTIGHDLHGDPDGSIHQVVAVLLPWPREAVDVADGTLKLPDDHE
jgi:hypothetical protein